jgi:type II secretory pathway component HofQ
VNVLQLSAISYSQSEKVNLQLKNASLKEVFSAIEEQTDYKFLYRDDILENIQVNVSENNVPLAQVLNKILASSNNTYKLLENNLVVISSKGNLQKQKVSGIEPMQIPKKDYRESMCW